MNINNKLKLTGVIGALNLIIHSVFHFNLRIVYVGNYITILKDVRLSKDQYLDILDSADIEEKIDLIKNIKYYYFNNIPEEFSYVFYVIYSACLAVILLNLYKSSIKNDK